MILYANRIGIWTTGTFILGFPYETREQMERTIKFAIDSDLDLAFFYCSTPFPGTDLKEIYEREGIEVPEDVSLSGGGVASLTMCAEEIVEVRNRAESRFIKSRALRPWKLFTKVRSLEDLRYVLRIILFTIRALRRGAGSNVPVRLVQRR